MSFAIDHENSSILGMCGIDMAAYGGNDLTPEELDTILYRCSQMFASQETMEDREVRYMEAIDRSTEGTAALSLIVTNIAAKQHEQDIRLVIVEECHKQKRRTLNAKMIGIALAVSIAGLVTSNLNHIATFFKTFAK